MTIRDLDKKIKHELSMFEDTTSEFADEFGLDNVSSAEDVEDEDFEDEDVENEEGLFKGFKIRIENDISIRGYIKNLSFDVKFRELADKINEEVPNVTITREKAHQIFTIIQGMLEESES
jgi:hypothetical protein